MEDGLFVVQAQEDAQPVVDRARMLRETDTDTSWKKYVGSVPVTLYHQWIIEAQQKGIWDIGQDGQLLNQFMVKKLTGTDEFAKLRGDR